MYSFASSLSALLALGSFQGALALDAAGWRNQSIYQVITDRFARTDGTAPLCDTSLGTFCGGSWKGITNNLDYIQNLGATAVWISPIVKNVDGYFDGAGEAYHGFWAEDIYSINPNFGTEADLKELAASLHARGMYLMVDIAPNHVGFPQVAGNYSNFKPFNSVDYFHSKCNIQWNNRKSEQLCWLEGLPDIRTENATVRQLYSAWIKDLVTTYSIDGLRIDTALEIEPEFWTDGGVKEAAGVYLLAEINHSAPETLAPYQQYVDGYMDYSTWNWFMTSFQTTEGNFSTLFTGTNTIAAMTDVDPSLWGSFVENHDQVRFPYRNEDFALAKNLYAAAMLRDGIPIVYYGQEQHYHGGATPDNREALWLGVGYDIYSELYGWIQQTNKIRKHAADANANFLTTERTQALFYDDSSSGGSPVIAFRKAQLLTMYTNGGVNGANNVSYALGAAVTGYSVGQQLVDVLNCHSFQVDSNGRLNVQMPAGGLPRAFLPVDQISGLCNNIDAPVSSATEVVTVDKNMGNSKRTMPFVTRREMRE
jgi:alpha-amylase